MLRDVLRSLFRRPVTEEYPFEKRTVTPRTRGKLQWDSTNCTGCGLCSKDCPADALEVITLDRKAKRFVVRYYMDRCAFCGQCVSSCRFNCLELVGDRWELAATSRKPFVFTFGKEEDINEALGNGAEANPAPA